MPSEKDKIEFKQCVKYDKMPYIVYADTELLIRKIDELANNLENSSTMKIGKHIPCGYSMSIVLGFNHIEGKRTLYKGKDCMKKLRESLILKRKNVTTNKKRIKIIYRCRCIYYIY